MKNKSRKTKGGWSWPLIGKKKESTEVAIYKPSTPSKRVLKRRTQEDEEEPKFWQRATIVGGQPSPKYPKSKVVGTNEFGSPFVGSKAYKKQIQASQKKEKAEREAEAKELARLEAIEKAGKMTEKELAEARAYEALARRRKAKRMATGEIPIVRAMKGITGAGTKRKKRKYPKTPKVVGRGRGWWI
jgi:hypothetical protein